MMSKISKKNNKSVIVEPSDSTIQQVKSSIIKPVNFSTGSNIVIRVEDLWKEYRLGSINHGTLAKDLQSWWARVRAKEDPNLQIDQSVKVSDGSTDVEQDRFWALKDISFEVSQGEVLGIIGKNGAGKSTLLKILSRVTTPTKGEIKIKGRVASLLEVGTGFHPELTGRENIFLNGAILGMSKTEIRRKLTEIVAFAEIEKFIDTPVKRYSSGMYVRLAFAVAAHLEPEILIVDEVLAVGDTAFQKKCLGKMKEVGKDGRTVLFVSHNMQAVNQLCDRGILLNQGIVNIQAPIHDVIEEYIKDDIQNNTGFIGLPNGKPVSSFVSGCLTVTDDSGDKKSQFNLREPWHIEFEFELERPLAECVAAVGIVTTMGVPLITFWSETTDLKAGSHSVGFDVELPLKACVLTFAVGISSRGHNIYYEEGLGHVIVNEIDHYGEQPYRASGGGALLCPKRAEIVSVL